LGTVRGRGVMFGLGCNDTCTYNAYKCNDAGGLLNCSYDNMYSPGSLPLPSRDHAKYRYTPILSVLSRYSR
jgi:hypothetical protein